MRIFILFFTLFSSLLTAGTFSLPLDSVEENLGTVKIKNIQKGVSGYVVRHFTQEQRTILANAVVTSFDKANGIAHLQFSEFSGLVQNSLPNGNWKPQVGDEVVLGFGYSRALLLAPTDEIYHSVTARIPSLEWTHPDLFATFLSYRGHPTPIKEDINDFCTTSSVGLLYIYLQNSLFTLDCNSLALLQITPLSMERGEEKLPFYYRFEKISEAWWGEGSDPLESYDPYYFHLIAKNNPKSGLLHHYAKKNEVPINESSSWFGGFFNNLSDVEIVVGEDDETEAEQQTQEQ